ncbi:MAG: isoprenylcysteine carboxylmethyltransferase family protein [Myxococcales bacterium]
MRLKELVGSGDRIGLFVLPVLVIGVTLNVAQPSFFSVGGPPRVLQAISIAMLVPGVTLWMWSVALILSRVPKKQLITVGPYSLVKHPLYTAVALLVLPWAGFLLDSWLGAVFGAVLYAGTRLFAPAEEAALAKAFGPAWDEYCRSVKLPWL